MIKAIARDMMPLFQIVVNEALMPWQTCGGKKSSLDRWSRDKFTGEYNAALHRQDSHRDRIILWHW